MKLSIAALIFSSLIITASVRAETVTGYGYSIDSAENMIKEKAKKKGASGYKIISARMGDRTSMTAVLLTE